MEELGRHLSVRSSVSPSACSTGWEFGAPRRLLHRADFLCMSVPRVRSRREAEVGLGWKQHFLSHCSNHQTHRRTTRPRQGTARATLGSLLSESKAGAQGPTVQVSPQHGALSSADTSRGPAEAACSLDTGAGRERTPRPGGGT